MKKIWTFLGITLFLSIIFYVLILSRESLEGAGGLVFGIMWCPGIAAIATCLIYNGNIKDLGWKLGKAKYLLLAFLIPVAYSLVPYSLIWVSGLGNFVPENFEESWLSF